MRKLTRSSSSNLIGTFTTNDLIRNWLQLIRFINEFRFKLAINFWQSFFWKGKRLLRFPMLKLGCLNNFCFFMFLFFFLNLTYFSLNSLDLTILTTFYPFCWCRNFLEMHILRRFCGISPETLRKLYKLRYFTLC